MDAKALFWLINARLVAEERSGRPPRNRRERDYMRLYSYDFEWGTIFMMTFPIGDARFNVVMGGSRFVVLERSVNRLDRNYFIRGTDAILVEAKLRGII